MDKKIQKESIKFLFISHEALSGDLAAHLSGEGHTVKAYIKASHDEDVYNGFFEKVDNYEKHLSWADVVVIDDTGLGKFADELRFKTKPVVGGSVYTDKLEDDREFGQKEMQEVGLTVLPRWNFKNYDTAIKFIQKNPGRYVYKPCGTISSEHKGLLFVAEEEDGSDLLDLLENNKIELAKAVKEFQLQKHVSGIEVACGAFFNGNTFVPPFNVNFEHKKLFNGEIGPMTGEMGTLMTWTTMNKLYFSTIAKMEKKLSKSGYVGYFDINCIATADAVYPLECTCRFGYPTISIQLEGINCDFGQFLKKISRNEPVKLETKTGYQIGVVIATPPFPFNDPAEFKRYNGMTIKIKDNDLSGIHIGDVKFEDEKLKIAGESGYTLIVTGSGKTINDARKETYLRVSKVKIQNMYYRTDIGQRCEEDVKMLKKWGWIS